MPASWEAWLDASLNFLNHLERVVRVAPLPMEQLQSLVGLLGAFSNVPQGIQESDRNGVAVNVKNHTFAIHQWTLTAEIAIQMDPASHDKLVNIDAFDTIMKLVLRVRHRVDANLVQALLLRMFHLLKGFTFKLHDPKALRKTLTVLLDLAITDQLDTLTHEVRKELDRNDALRLGGQV